MVTRMSQDKHEVASKRSESIIAHTQTLCPDCGRPAPAELFGRDDNVWLRRHCPNDGEGEELYWRDAELFHRLMAQVGDYVFCRSFECLDGVACERCLEKAYCIMLDLTDRCDLNCPVCCSAGGTGRRMEPSLDWILDRLPPPRRGPLSRWYRPNVVLFGGEPTLRPDLPEMIRQLSSRGYIPRLATNGLRMCDDQYLDELRDAGLRWVILQFDGFDEGISEQLRGKALVDRKLRGIENMAAHGFKVQLGMMVVKGINLEQLGRVLEFVGHHDKLFWLSLYPHSAQNRMGLTEPGTHVADVLEELRRATEGRIEQRDFADSMRFLGRLHRLLRVPSLRQKLSTLPLVLVFEKGDYFPLTRLFRPRFALRHLGSLARLLLALPRILLYQSADTPPFLKFLIVEKVHSGGALDLEEAGNCHMSFMT
jgi:7,8-dihydro-6-hydroxymethylpterin dimethyltransferase